MAGWNDAAGRLFGYAEAEILGQPFARFFTPDDAGRDDPEHARARGRIRGPRRRRPLVGAEGRHVVLGRRRPHRPARRARPAARLRPGDARPHRTAPRPGTPRKARAPLRALIEHGWDAVCLLSAAGDVLYASPSTDRIHGHSRHDFVGRKALELVHPDDLPRLMETFSRLLARPGQTLTCSFRYRHADGRWLWLEGVGTNLLDEPSVRAIVVNHRDVTQQGRPTAARTSSWPCWPTSCATRWPRCHHLQVLN